jgi:two-component system, cell cycle sensor histidine kinase and response regulator CckA
MDPLPPHVWPALLPLLDQLKAARLTTVPHWPPIWSIDRQLWLVAGAAIHDPGREDASTAGVLLMARHFDEAELAAFSDVLMMPVGISFDDPGHAGVHAHPVWQAKGDDQVHAVIRDHAGRPVAELLLTPDRRLAQAASSLAWTGMGLALLAGLLATLILVPLLDRLLLRRLQACMPTCSGCPTRARSRPVR